MRNSKPAIWFFAAVLLFLSSCSQGTRSPSQTDSASAGSGVEGPSGPIEYAAPTRPATKLALLVGIDKYSNFGNRPAFSDLAGCVNDVELVKGVLIGKFEFPKENILVLTNAEATRAGIIEAFQKHLIAKAQRDDIVVFHYSGHGSQMKDVSADEVDGLDETIVPHDSRDPEGKVFDISDDDLNGLLRLLSQRTQNVTFILDSCHSGTATRAGALARRIPADDREPPASPEPFALSSRGAEGESGLRPNELNYVLISGSRSRESSFEHWANDREHGAMTYFLVNELRSAGAGMTYRDIMDVVKGKVSSRYPSQHPQLEGAQADHFVFSDSSSIAQAFILCSPVGAGRVMLEAGQVHGITTGSVYEIYRPGTKQFEPPESPIAKAEVTRVGSFNAEARIVQGGQIPEFSRAVERQRQYGDLKLRVYYENPNESVLRSIKAQLDRFQHIEAIAQPRGYHLLLRRAQNEIIIEGGDGTEISPRIAVSDARVVARVIDRVTQWAKWFNVLSIANPVPSLTVKFAVKPVEQQTRGTFRQVGEAELVLPQGERFQCVIENTSRKNLYITILDLSTDGSVSVIYPREGAAELLPAGATWTQTFETYLPEGFTSVKDVLRLFATTTQLDFRFLEQDAIRGGESLTRGPGTDPLAQLLAQAALGTTRGARPLVLADWITAERVIEVRRNSQ